MVNSGTPRPALVGMFELLVCLGYACLTLGAVIGLDHPAANQIEPERNAPLAGS